jgi:hypothetical protein
MEDAMNAPVKSLDFTKVKRKPLSRSAACEHRIGMPILQQHRNEELAVLERHRAEELALLERLLAEAAMLGRYSEG